MTRWALLFFLLILLLLAAVPLYGQDWTVLRETQDAVIPIKIDDKNACTAWRFKPGYYVTVAHCTTDKDSAYLYIIKAGGENATVVRRNLDRDLAIISIPPDKLDGPVLRLSNTPIKLGEAVAAFGYAGGLPHPFYTFGRISRLILGMPTGNGQTMTGLIIYGGFITGMSGGPVLNEAGEVVSMCKGTGPPYGAFHDIAIGVQHEHLRDFIAGI